MATNQKYLIETIADLFKIPVECIDAFCRDLQYMMEFNAFVTGSDGAIPLTEIEWCDDDNHSVELFDSDGKTVLKLDVTDLSQAE